MPQYNRIGKSYDVTRKADPYIVQRLIHYLNIQDGKNYLDLACGTGNYTIAIANMGVCIFGLDESDVMIETASLKCSSINWYKGNAEFLPFLDRSFSGAICILAIHHFHDLLKAFSEVYRILLKGRFVLFTTTPEQIKGYWLNEYFPEALLKSIHQMPSLDFVVANLTKAGFTFIGTEKYEVNNELQDLFLYGGKHRPEIYLDPQVRSAISTFASSADISEVEKGCKKLIADIQAGRMLEILNKYAHNQGDYLFVVAEK